MSILLLLFNLTFAASPHSVTVPWPTNVTNTWNDHKYHVALFWSPHCGCIGRQKEFIYSLQNDFAKDSIEFIFVDVGSPDQKTTDKMAKLFKFKGVYVNDKDKKITKALGAKVTPEVFVLNSKNEILYESGFLKENPKSPSHSEELLRPALNELLKSGTITKNKTESEGCFIEPGSLTE